MYFYTDGCMAVKLARRDDAIRKPPCFFLTLSPLPTTRPCRAIFQSDVNDASSPTATDISLDNAEEVFAWAKFIGQDLKSVQPEDLRKAVPLRHLLFMLGATLTEDDSDGNATALRFAPGRPAGREHPNRLATPISLRCYRLVFTPCVACADCKCTLLQLPSVHALRASIHAKLTATTDVEPTVLTSAAGIGNETELASVAAAVPLNPRLSRTLTGHSSTVSGVAVCADGKHLVSSSWDKTGKVWSLSTGEPLRTFTRHGNKDVNCLALFFDDKRAISGAYDNAVRIWNIDSVTEARAFMGHTKPVRGVAVSPDDRTVASADQDSKIKIWNVGSGQCVATLTGHSGIVWCVAFSADGYTLASGSDDSKIKLWSMRAHSLERTITGHTSTVEGVAFAGERLVSCSHDKTIRVWERQSGKHITTFSLHTDTVHCVAVFPNGDRAVSGSADKTIRIWNLRSGMCEHTLEGHTGVVRSVAVSRDGCTLASGSADSSVKVWALR